MLLRKALIIVPILATTLLLLRLGEVIPAGLVTLLAVFYPTIDKLVTHYFIKSVQEETKEQQQHDPNIMTTKEAMNILGLTEKPTKENISEAYKRLMMKNHPDQGGNEYLAAKINLAKQILLDEIS